MASAVASASAAFHGSHMNREAYVPRIVCCTRRSAMAKTTKAVTEPKVLTLSSEARWEQWLLKNHERTPQGVWLRLFNKGSGRKSLTYAEAVDVAVCFGWIDGQAKSYDDESRVQRF